MKLPVINIEPLIRNERNNISFASEIRQACETFGFFYIKGHGISEALQDQLTAISQQFFYLSTKEKMKIHMSKGGSAWRGYFPIGEELTAGRPDMKEGLYFGQELPDHHPMVANRTPLHGKNLFPDGLKDFRKITLEYVHEMTLLGHALMRGLSLSLNLPENYFHEHYTKDPLILFRIFHYPPDLTSEQEQSVWGVGEHTDYGVLTILKQDEQGGLQVKSKGEWITAPYLPNTFVCNIGDMLERMTAGRYISTPHRVKNQNSASRFSFPFFFDPNWNIEVKPLPVSSENEMNNTSNDRWDGANVHDFRGSYGSYILQKVAKVFPQLKG